MVASKGKGLEEAPATWNGIIPSLLGALPPDDPDAAIRAKAFEHLRCLNQFHDHLTAAVLAKGFLFGGEQIAFFTRARGIFKPKQMRSLLSIRTAIPRPGRKVWYDDQRQVHRQIFLGDETVEYAFQGDDPQAADNRLLKDAWERRLPIIYFLGVAPGVYQALFPAFIVGWDAQALSARVAFGAADSASDLIPQTSAERRYALRSVKQRLHQSAFREAVLAAYDCRCAITKLPETRLLDAAHIIADTDAELGHPIIQNGILLTKLHHAAFDRHLIGIDSDYRLHVSRRLLKQKDGPMLDALKALQGMTFTPPLRKQDQPDRDRLSQRFKIFRSAS